MRHGDKVNNLGRKKGHRDALLKNLANALVRYKRINTTLAKAKALRVYLEPLVTKGKNNTTHSRRVVFGYLQDKESIKELFGPIAAKVGDRPGGYLRIIKTGFRSGDGAETAMIEFVDFNEVMLAQADKTPGKKKTRRGRTKSAASSAESDATGAESENTATETKED